VKKIAISILLFAIGCVGCVQPDELHTSTSYSEPTFAVGPADWVLGTWDCVGQYDDAVPPFRIHDENAVYDFSLGKDGDVHGVYTVTPDGTEPVAGTHETWSIGVPVNGEAPASIAISTDPGAEVPFSAQATGSVFGSMGPNVQGISEFFTGTIEFQGKETVPWATSMLADTFSGSPELLISSYLGQNGLFLYFESTCAKRVPERQRAASPVVTPANCTSPFGRVGAVGTDSVDPNTQCPPAFGPDQLEAAREGTWSEARRGGYGGCECPDDTVNLWRPFGCHLYSDGSKIECSVGWGGNLLTTCSIFFQDMSVVSCTTVRMR
jgi:hypothetical protein